jgi:hypothetical protein
LKPLNEAIEVLAPNTIRRQLVSDAALACSTRFLRPILFDTFFGILTALDKTDSFRAMYFLSIDDVRTTNSTMEAQPSLVDLMG